MFSSSSPCVYKLSLSDVFPLIISSHTFPDSLIYFLLFLYVIVVAFVPVAGTSVNVLKMNFCAILPFNSYICILVLFAATPPVTSNA